MPVSADNNSGGNGHEGSGDDQPAPPPATLTSVEAAMRGARPEGNDVTALSRAQIAATLFGGDDGLTVGRFRILERLGAGGMGIVYAAYDPDLRRAVAVKLVKVRGPTSQTALREAQALARLSHPHVVPIYDVGLHEDSVFMVMELVRGQTLRRWTIGRSQAEILRVYREAGLALAVAHRAGLVHRDFKPDNALVGEDGRVRVVDFGLACDQRNVEVPNRAGTPAYMAPEQALGAPVSPASDQYSFSRSLAESLTYAGGPPTPRWLLAVLERASAQDPSARFRDMEDLLRALSQDTAVRRKRRVLASILAATMAGIFLAGRSTRPTPADICEAGSQQLAEALGAARPEQTLARLHDLGQYGHVLHPLLNSALTNWQQRWVDGYKDACTAHRRGLHSAQMLDRRMLCLERGRSSLRAVVQLIGAAEPRTLAQLPLAVRALPDPAACADLASLNLALAEPPSVSPTQIKSLAETVARARVHVAAGRYRQGAELAAAGVAQAQAMGHPAAEAEALLVQGHAIMSLDPRTDALPLLQQATRLALVAGAVPIGVEAWARRAWVQATVTPDDLTATAGRDVIESLIERWPKGDFQRALLHNNLGSIELARRRPDQARAAFSQALDESRNVEGAGAIELINVRVNLALIESAARRDMLLAEAEQRLTNMLGADHPQTLEVGWIRGARMESLSEAEDRLTATCPRFEQHTDLAGRSARCWSELAFVREQRGAHVDAIAALERGARLGPAALRENPEIPAYLALLTGKAQVAEEMFNDALVAAKSRPGGPTDWHRQRIAGFQLGLGRSLRALGRLAAAQDVLDAAVATLAQIGRDKDLATNSRRLSQARAESALVRSQRGNRGTATARLAKDALIALHRVGADERLMAQLRALTPH